MSYLATQYDVSNYHDHEIDFCSLPSSYTVTCTRTLGVLVLSTQMNIYVFLHVLPLQNFTRIILCYRFNILSKDHASDRFIKKHKIESSKCSKIICNLFGRNKIGAIPSYDATAFPLSCSCSLDPVDSIYKGWLEIMLTAERFHLVSGFVGLNSIVNMYHI